MEKLSKRHLTFSSSEIRERKLLAMRVLKSVESDKWSYVDDWIKDSCLLEKYENSSKSAMMRLIMGSTMKKWLTTFLHGKITNQKLKILDGRYSLYGPFFCDNLKIELLCDINTPEKELNIYDECSNPGTVSLVLGAGNMNFLSIIDVFERVFIHKECVFLKHHPLRPFLYEPYSIILEPLISENIVHMVYDTSLKSELIKNPHVSHIHFTGSENTYKAITKELSSETNVTAELGCATPWIIMPGYWTDKEIKNAVKQIVIAKISGGGSYCMSAQVILIPQHWKQKEIFCISLNEELKKQTPEPAYYPGSIKRKNEIVENCFEFLENFDNSITSYPSIMKRTSERNNDVVLIDCGILNGNSSFNNYCFDKEVFCPVLVKGEIDYEEGNTDDYLERVCDFANKELHGSLSCSVLFPDSLHSEYIIEKCIKLLDYGTIAINIWSVIGYMAALVGGTWGAHYNDRKSGRGRIGNIYKIKYVSKTIIRGQKLENETNFTRPLPPKIIINLIYLLTVKCSTFFEKCVALLKFIFFKSYRCDLDN